MTFTPIGLQASDIAALIATDSAWVASVPRHPNGEATRHVGGG